MRITIVAVCILIVAIVAAALTVEQTRASRAPDVKVVSPPTTGPSFERIEKSDEQWRQVLTPEQFDVMRRKGTERAFSGAYNDNKRAGIYHCAACELPLFDSATKFDSGTGWPSFYQPVFSNYMKEVEDRSHGMVRTEVVCPRCDGHLGHVFDDGPKPTGLRYCINSVALKFVPRQAEK